MGPNYTVIQPEVALPRGESGRLELRIVPHSGFKINLEYPWRLTLEASDALTPEAAEWTADAAQHFTEEEVVFEIPVAAGEPGQGRVDGHLRFSVCNDARCDTPREDVAWAVTVE
jgi:hypothetical protein